MKHTTSGGTFILRTMFTENELDVCDILLDLEDLFFQSDSRTKFSFKWGATKRRSAIDSTPSPPRLPCLQKPKHEEREIDSKIPKLKTEVTSPSTPLAFSPSESEEKSKKNSKKMPRKKWSDIIDGLTQRKELLTREVDVVRSYYNKLLTFNLALKAKKDELKSYRIKKNTQLEIERGFGVKVDQQEYHPFPNQSFRYPTAAYQPQISETFKNQNGQISAGGLGLVNQAAGPHGIPDLNVCYAEETTFGMRLNSSPSFQAQQPFEVVNRRRNTSDDAKLIAAEKRRSRMIKIINKNKLLLGRKRQRSNNMLGNCPS